MTYTPEVERSKRTADKFCLIKEKASLSDSEFSKFLCVIMLKFPTEMVEPFLDKLLGAMK